MTGLLLNIAALQITWFSCVLGAANGWPWAGVVVAALAITLHLARAARPAAELALILSGGALGVIFEGALMAGGFARYAGEVPFEGLPPAWLVALWMVFATTLNVSLAWLKERPLLAAALGAVAGMIAYAGGARLGAMTLAEPLWVSLAAVGLMWGMALPLLGALARRLGGG